MNPPPASRFHAASRADSTASGPPPNTPALAQQAVYLLLAVVGVVGLLYSLDNQYRLWRSGDIRPRLDVRYAGLQRVLPADRRLGYVSDEPVVDGPGKDLFYQTQYAVVPHVLLLDTAPDYVIANVTQPSRLPELCRHFRLVPVVAVDAGLVLLQHATPP